MRSPDGSRDGLGGRLGNELGGDLFSLAVAIAQMVDAVAQQQRDLVELLHDVDDTAWTPGSAYLAAVNSFGWGGMSR
jgi:hypothetical protein